MNNFKIVYKKPTLYEDDSISSSINSNDSNESNISICNSVDSNVNSNVNSNELNLDLRNNIFKEISNDINNLYQKNNNTIDSIESIKNNDDLYKMFVKYINNNNIDFTNKQIFNLTVKKFILFNNLNHEQILILLNSLKNKFNYDNNSNNNVQNNNIISNNIISNNNISNDNDSNDNVSNDNISNDNLPYDKVPNDNFETFQNYNNSIIFNENTLFNNLIHNDINTWIFMCVIIISLIIIIMMVVYKK